MTPTAVAIHEAGHAIVAMAQGLQLGCVTVIPNRENNSAGTSQNEPGELAIDEATVFYAGWEAENLLDPVSAAENRWGSSSDDELAAHQLSLLRGENATELETTCREVARRLLAERWATVYAVAVDLDYWKKLDCIECDYYFEGGDDADVASELAEYRVRCPDRDLAIEQADDEYYRLLAVLKAASAAAEKINR